MKYGKKANHVRYIKQRKIVAHLELYPSTEWQDKLAYGAVSAAFSAITSFFNSKHKKNYSEYKISREN
jgi:hypothetical protein